MAKFAVNTLEFDKVKTLLADQAGTSLGRKLALDLVSSSRFEQVKLAQEETAEAVQLLDEGKRLPLGGMTDISPLVKRTRVGSILEPEDFKAIGDTIDGLRHLKQFLLEDTENAPALRDYGPQLGDFSRLSKQLSSALDEKGNIKDNASVKLQGLRTGILAAKNRVKDKLNSLLHDPNNQKYFQDALVTMREDRYVIPIKQEYRLNFPGVVHDQSASGATLFVEPMAVVNLNNDIKKYRLEEQAEVERILRTLTGHVGSEAENILSSLDIAAQVDLIGAKAALAALPTSGKVRQREIHLPGALEHRRPGKIVKLLAFVAQAKAGDVVIAVGIHVSVAAALDVGQDVSINVLILCVAGNVVGGGADFSQSAVGQLNIIGQSDDGLVGRHGQAQLAGGVESTDNGVDLSFTGVSQRSSGRLVDDTLDIQAGNGACVLGGLTLAVVEVSRYGDDGFGDFFTQIPFRIALHLFQDHGGNLFRRVVLAIDGHSVFGAHVPFDGADGPFRVGYSLAFGQLAYQSFPVFRKANHGRSQPAAFLSGDNRRFAAFHHSDYGVGGPQVNTNNLRHNEFLLSNLELSIVQHVVFSHCGQPAPWNDG